MTTSLRLAVAFTLLRPGPATCLALLLALALGPAGARDLLDYRLEADRLLIETSDGPLSLRFHGPDALEVHYQPAGRRQLPSFSLLDPASEVATTLHEQPTQLNYASASLRAEIQKSPLQIRYYRGDTLLLAEEAGLFHHETLRGFRFELQPDEKLLGAGQRVMGMDRRGHRLALYNRPHYGYSTESQQMYFSLPALMSSRKYLLLFDNSANGHVDIGHSEPDVLQFEAVAGRSAYVVVAGDNYPQIIANYVAATGLPPLPARWTLGNYASRFGYRSEEQARDVVRRFREARIPLDALVLDLYWFGPDIKGHMGNLDWDRDAFPDPEGMMADLAADGVQTILVTEPFVLTSSTRWQEAVAAGALATNLAGAPRRFDFYFGNSGLIDVFKPEAISWFQNIYAELTRQGVAGWWGDLGEPEVHPHDTVHALGTAEEIHNAYGHQWARLVYEGQRALRPDSRPFIMMRAGAPGSQRYGMVPWTGDVERSWGGLQSQVELALQMSLFGFGWIHSDLGGFAGGERFNRELYLRWMQYGVFQPVYRPHAQDHIAPEPVFHDRRTRRMAREFIRLRYALLPYHYTLAWEHSQSGMPLMRPLFFEDENDTALIDRHDAYLWGDAFLVAPVVSPRVRRARVELPRGVWFDYWTGQRHVGPVTATVATPLDRIPVFARAGAFVPMVEPVERTRDYNSQRLQIHYWADPSVASSEGRMYEDDGHSFDAGTNGAFELLQFRAEASPGKLSFQLQREGGEYPGRPPSREITLLIHHAPADLQVVVVNGVSLPAGQRNRQGLARLKFRWTDDAIEVDPG